VTWVALGIGLATTAYGAYTQHEAGKEGEKGAKYNQQIGLLQAEDALTQGVYDQNRYRRSLKQFLGSQRAAIGANNVTQSGSPLRLLEDSAQIGEEDIANIRNNAALESWGYKVGADQAGLRARQSRRAGDANAAGMILGGTASAYGTWRLA
jgi:hypothetical protein